MGVSFPPIPAPSASKSLVTQVAASVTATVIGANPDRVSGLITNTANKSLWVRFGDPAAAPATGNTPATIALTAAIPAIQVPAGGNIDIPEGYIGMIGLIWSSNGLVAGGIALVVELIP